MLLRFGVGNFRSIRDYSEVSLVASNAIKDRGLDLLSLPASKAFALPFVLIYGANASGKSALYSALGTMRSHVANSFAARKPGAPIPYSPFALDDASGIEPTRIDCDFILDNVRYHYGFEYDRNQYKQEWLYSFPESYRRILFQRFNDEIEFGPTLKGRNKSISELSRSNSLFISTAAQNSHPQLTPIYNWISKSLIGATATVDNEQFNSLENQDLDHRIVTFLKYADTGIIGARVKSESPPEDVLTVYKSIVEAIKKISPDDSVEPTKGPDNITEVTFSHAAKDGRSVELPYEFESRGTRRLIGLLMKTFQAIDNGSVLFVDELDASLHTLLSMQLISLFSDASINTRGAQLIATTHDTNILCSDKVRRDQIWFTEKDSSGATCVYPLTDIKTRNSDNLEKGYLQGRYGAIPFFGSSLKLFGKTHD